jgi:Ca2+-binding RTX toxin-like protein
VSLRRGLIAALAAALTASSLAIAAEPAEPPASPGPPGFAADMDSGLVDLALADPAQAAAVADARQLRLRGDRVVVEVLIPPGRADQGRAAVAEAGGTVVGGTGRAIEAAVPVDALAELGRESAIAYLRTPLPSVPDAVTGEGVEYTLASIAHESGFDGAGVQVTIMDVGFAGYASSVAEGDLPAGLPMLDLCTNFNSTAHGTQVAEVVHDMAPGAQLSLACTDTSGDTQAGVNFAKAQGADVISRSLGDPGTTRGDGSGGPGTAEHAAEDALANGILWVNSAGNYARSHWRGSFATNPDSDANLDWVATGDELNGVTIGAGQQQCFRAKWDSWPATGIDYQLRLWQLSPQVLVASSATVQNGTQQPRESLCYTNPGPTQNYGIAIERASAPGPLPRIDVWALDAVQIQHVVAAGSVNDVVGAPEVFSVAAICRLTDAIQPYSSQGPTIDGRVKPDIGGPTNVSSSFAATSGCSGGFGGTSAAAPHVAGAAALYKQALGLAPQALRDTLEAGATDLGDAGKDNVFGAGRMRVALARCAGTLATIVGTTGADVLTGTSGKDVVAALEGNDRVKALGGKDLVCGGAGNDLIRGGRGKDRLLGEAGRDKLVGGRGRDRLRGGAGRDKELQ